MNWKNLKNYKCPKCNALLIFEIKLGNMHSCTKCDFGISKEKFENIVNDINKPKQRCVTFEQNMSDLNNFDRPEVAEDFSDSPYKNEI